MEGTLHFTRGDPQNIIKQPYKAEFIVRTKMTAYTHKKSWINYRDQICISKIYHEEKLENLLILLSDEMQESKKTITSLASKNDALQTLYYL